MNFEKKNGMIQVGDTYQSEFSFSQEEVNRFAELTGDRNPIHIDSEYAASTQFKKPIMHGVLSASIFSKILGMEFPGKGTIYMGQEIQFKRPMFPSELYEAKCEVVSTNERRHIAIIQTEVYHKKTGKQTISGKATVLNSERV